MSPACVNLAYHFNDVPRLLSFEFWWEAYPGFPCYEFYIYYPGSWNSAIAPGSPSASRAPTDFLRWIISLWNMCWSLQRSLLLWVSWESSSIIVWPCRVSSTYPDTFQTRHVWKYELAITQAIEYYFNREQFWRSLCLVGFGECVWAGVSLSSGSMNVRLVLAGINGDCSLMMSFSRHSVSRARLGYY